ncbi:MAG TPA: alpha/beta fold hydrolase [Thermoanaerobaculia bacterium]|nr:alpha/beta fold hydrolase [Thermoanaerobaculia bacterium]
MNAFLALLVLAQIQISVNVRVTRDHSPVSDALVIARDAAGNEWEARTDEQGQARLLVPPGEYQFEARYDREWRGRGFGRAAVVIGATLEVNIAIEGAREAMAESAPEPVQSIPPPPPITITRQPPYAVVRVHFATDRALSGYTNPAARFNGDREPGERLRLGVSEVSIPRNHKIGALEEASIFRLELTDDPTKHVVILKTTLQKATDFYRDFGKSEAIVFIHGYANTFSDAVRRAAQIKYDLAFDGPIVAYTWPSRGTLEGYPADVQNVEWTAPHLQSFLQTLAQKSGSHAIHVIAHSMGTRVLGQAIKSLANVPNAPTFNQIVLAAPDIDASIFKRDIAPAMKKISKHVTLYASSNDQALIASKKVHGYPRAGDSGAGIVTVDGIETIDVTDVDTSLLGHSYVGENRTILSDLYCALRGLPQAIKRCGLQRQGGHWRFARALAETGALSTYECDAATCTQ